MALLLGGVELRSFKRATKFAETLFFFINLKGQSREIFRVFLQQSSIDQNQERRR
jgi:hypothetical protein